jgi:hypothetical protein
MAVSEMPESTLLDAVARDVAKALRVPLCAVLELESTWRWLTLVAGEEWEPDVVGSGLIPAGSSSQAGLTLRLETPVVCSDLPRTPCLSAAMLLRRHGVASGVSAMIGLPDARRLIRTTRSEMVGSRRSRPDGVAT